MNVDPLTNNLEVMPPPLDYLEHPAFKILPRQIIPWDEEKIAQLIEQVDLAYKAIDQCLYTAKRQLFARIETELVSKVDAFGEVVLGHLDNAANRLWIEESIRVVKEVLRENLVSSHKAKHYKSNRSASLYASQIDHLKKNGFAIFAFPQELKDRLIDECAPHLNDLRRRMDARPGVRAAVSVPPKGMFGKVIEKIVNDYGVVIAASEYRKCKMEFLYASLELSRPTHRWYKDCYEDVGLPTSKTVTMHYDYESTMMKAMIYLTPVAEINGATGVVAGSHLWKRSPFLFAFLNELDHQYPNVYPNRHNEEDYYRPRFKYLDERERFANLPKVLQGTSHFGDDVLDNSPLSEFLLKNEIRFVSDAPECLLFDGPQAIHRGGMVLEGERIALQLAFRMREDFAFLKRVMRKVKRVAALVTGLKK